VRVFGEPRAGLRFEVEGMWGTRSRDGSDVFGTAYPYEGEADLGAAYATFARPASRGIRSIRAGRYRPPFGISSASEHAYVGFLRPPLIRYGGYYALSNSYFDHGVDVIVGAPRLSLRASVGVPWDVGDVRRRPGAGGTVRIEGHVSSFVLGVSYIDTTPDRPPIYAHGRARFAGVDVRWMQNGLMLRGEWLGGRPFEGTATRGGYVDVLVHRPSLGPVTLLARAERLAYDARAPFSLYTHRYSAGARVRVWRSLSISSMAVHQSGQQTQRRPTAIDVGVTYAVRHDF
jgi:hypothetical protein